MYIHSHHPQLGDYSSPFLCATSESNFTTPMWPRPDRSEYNVLSPDHSDWFRDQEGYVTRDSPEFLGLTTKEGKIFSLSLWELSEAYGSHILLPFFPETGEDSHLLQEEIQPIPRSWEFKVKGREQKQESSDLSSHALSSYPAPGLFHT